MRNNIKDISERNRQFIKCVLFRRKVCVIIKASREQRINAKLNKGDQMKKHRRLIATIVAVIIILAMVLPLLSGIFR